MAGIEWEGWHGFRRGLATNLSSGGGAGCRGRKDCTTKTVQNILHQKEKHKMTCSEGTPKVPLPPCQIRHGDPKRGSERSNRCVAGRDQFQRIELMK